MIDGWTPGIGDPGVIGWATVALYLVAAGVCASVAARTGPRSDARFWTIVAVAMLALGINKQLDLQSLFTHVLRENAERYGWFAERRALQLGFIITVAACGLVLMAVVAYRLSVLRRNMRTAAIGVCLIYTYVMIRAASFHHVDRLISAAILGVRWNWVLEIGGIAIVLIAALRARFPSVS